MKKIAFMSVLAAVLVSLVFIGAASALDAMAVTMNGTIIDNACASGHGDGLAELVKTHTKECALMSFCAASGYSIFSDGKLYRFDKAGSAKVEKFLRQDNSKLQVTVVVKNTGEELELVSIENQK